MKSRKHLERALTAAHRDVIRDLFGGNCFVPQCGHGTDVAHLVSKGSNPHYRWEYMNGVYACRIHHGWLDGQSSNEKQVAMRQVIMEMYPLRYRWMREHQNMHSEKWTDDELEHKLRELRHSHVVLCTSLPFFCTLLASGRCHGVPSKA